MTTAATRIDVQELWQRVGIDYTTFVRVIVMTPTHVTVTATSATKTAVTT